MLAFDAHSHLQLRSWFSNVYFRPSIRLSEPTGSTSIALKGREQETLCPPCARSAEYFLRPVTAVHSIILHRRKNSEHTRDTLSKQLSNDSSFVFHSHSVSIGSVFGVSFHIPTTLQPPLPYFFIYVVASENLFDSSYLLRMFLPPALACLSLHARAARKLIMLLQMLCCKIFVLKYFRRMPTL